jgi:hypothetical protein
MVRRLLWEQEAEDSTSSFAIKNTRWCNGSIVDFESIGSRSNREWVIKYLKGKIMEKELHPVQKNQSNRQAFVNTDVTLRAYEVYCHVFQPQEAMITGNCRGGFGTGELIAFLYARSFPKNEWKDRVYEAFDGQANL